MSLKNSTFLDLKNLTFALIGREYASDTAQFGRLVSLWNQGAKRAYRASNYWDRHLVIGEPRTVTSGFVESDEDSFNIQGAGLKEANGLYQYGMQYDGHDAYVLNGNSISFELTSLPNVVDQEFIGEYRMDSSYDSLHSNYSRGVWVNQSNPDKLIAYNSNSSNWALYDLEDDNADYNSATSTNIFPWMDGSLNSVTFSGFPEKAYQMDRNSSNNHWEIVQSESNGTTTVLYKNGGGGTPSENNWEIVNAIQPAPEVVDVKKIDSFLRIYKQEPFRRSSVQEMDFNSRGGRAYLITNSDNSGVVYVTYKEDYTPEYTTSSVDGDSVPDEYMNYMAHYAAYTWQRSVDQNSSENNFGLSLGLVNQILEDELARIESQGILNSNAVKKFKTYRNT